ncbi:MAG: sigma-54 dependent transcriptional regulator [Gemmataceae bacterium]|nr:sigma-54 dependent transcriptional regulator [Gemmataceae bacterium]MCI0740550.1 sigma-54 dependent transcriptional regulator [Gemmataceae bacterium]
MAGSAVQASAWLDSWSHGRNQPPEEMMRELIEAGVELSPRTGPLAPGPGLLIFDTLSAPLLEFVREASCGGVQRILAIAEEVAPLAEADCWTLLDAGAADVLPWRSGQQPAVVVRERLRRWHETERLLQAPEVAGRLVGHSPVWREALRRIVEVAAFTSDSVLITGESGTGKELLARLMHTLDRRTDKGAFVVLDCSAVTPTLSGSEFFGHERGAFTGAVAERDGAFALADKGTLFLDEVGELPLTLQAELLRVIEERTYKRVGSNTWRQTHFRLVCATNRDLEREQAEGRFRSDLYYRIAQWTCQVPPLRERVEDILLLAQHFLQQAPSHSGAVALEAAVRDYLVRRPYPGNVRELKHLVARMAGRHVGPGPITVGDIPNNERPSRDDHGRAWHVGDFETAIRRALGKGIGLKDISRNAEEIAIRLAVEDTGGNLQKAAAKLGVTDRALQMRRAARRQKLDT